MYYLWNFTECNVLSVDYKMLCKTTRDGTARDTNRFIITSFIFIKKNMRNLNKNPKIEIKQNS